MTAHQTRPSLLTRLQDIAGFVEGVRSCAAAGRANRTPSRDALNAIGLDAASFHEGR